MRLIWIGLTLCLSSCLSAACPHGQYACTSGECVDVKLRCNHVSDCRDGSDEVLCDNPCSSPFMKPCRDGHCIAQYFFCDEKNDCGDWSDETNCTKLAVEEGSIVCPPNTFRCDGKQQHPCLPLIWICDGMEDCPGGKDEHNCTSSHECKDGFQCGKECIYNQWVCDGVEDCADGSDEKECGPDGILNHACYPEHGWFSCMNKGTKKCMPINRVCDGYTDCDDKMDEGGQCNTTTNCSSIIHCEYGCHMTPTGPICTCPQGFRLERNTCVDIDECAISPPICSHFCKNLRGGYECSCLSDYTLNNRDNRSCIANGPELTLFVTTGHDIRSIAFPSREYKLVYPSVTQVHGITGYIEQGFIFWNEKSKDRAGIFKAMEDGTNHQAVVAVGVEVVEDVEIDWVGRHVYFTDAGHKHIVACDVYGTLCTVVISSGLDKPRAIALHPEERLLFWSDWGSHPHIGSAGMDGSNRKDIITKDIVWPNGLAVDETVQRIFWSDGKLGRIESSRLDGSQRVILPVTMNHPYGIDIFEDNIYWTDLEEREVRTCNKHTGKNQKVLMKEASLTPTGVYAHHPSKQRHFTNPCWNVLCSHLCLSSPNSDGFRCACPAGMTLNANNRTCHPNATMKSSLIIATFTELYQVTHQQIGKDSVVRLPTRFLENIGALAFNPLDHCIVYSDLGKKVIYSMHLESNAEKVLFENAEGVEGIAVDPYTGNVYWTEVAQGTLVVGNIKMDGQEERIVLARGLHSPRNIVLAPEHGLMFIVEGRQSQTIYVWHMDGSSRKEFVHAYGTVTGMSCDGGYLYFSDSTRGTIEKIALDGSERKNLRTHLSSPVAMDAVGDAVFWLTQSSTRINWLTMSDPKATRGFFIDASEDSGQYRIVEVVDQYNFSTGHVCLDHTGGCSDICAPTPTGAKCLCPPDKKLADDMHVCHPANCSDVGMFQCHSKCIPTSYRCNGVNDCALGEDEKDCHNDTTTSFTCSEREFRCTNGVCIHSSFVCDGDFDCSDKSDEPDTCAPHTCGPKEYACPQQKRCIPFSAKCDGQNDCNDGSDEVNCTPTCSHDQFFCERSKLCIPETWLCDKQSDCKYGEDEELATCSFNATSGKCPPGFIRCPGQMDCFPRSVLCRSDRECASSTEQQLCALLNEVHTEVVIAQKSCSDDEFMCYMGSNDCIALSSKCNCKFECKFGEDEEGCPPCEEGLFRCPGEMRYIDPTWVCDGLNDCVDGSDENSDLCQANTPTPSSRSMFECPEDEFECLNGQCIPLNLTCDGVPHCTDGTDEGTKCDTSCELDNGNCSQLCRASPKGPICECEPGYASLNNGRTCLDMDECESGQHLCSQYCSNTKGGYKCSCAAGYKLEYDQRTCKLVGGRPMIVAAGPYEVELLLNIYETSGRQLFTSEDPIKDIVYHDQSSTLYLVTSAGVSRTSSRGTKILYQLNDLLPSAIALDRATGNVYLSALVNTTNGQDRSIIKVITSPTNADVNIITTRSIITDLVTDSSAGVLFWAEHSKSQSGRIIRSAMDGSSSRWLHSLNKVEYPIALALDSIQRRVYWSDFRQHTISSCDYEGGKQKIIVSNTQGQPLSMVFFESRIVWSTLGQSTIYSQVVHNATIIAHQLSGAVTQVTAVHSALEPALPNPCANSPCNNGICVLKNNATFSCYCPQGVAVLSSNPFKCRESATNPDPNVIFDERDFDDGASAPGITIATVIVCLAVLSVLALLGCIYYKRWRRSVGTPLKFRFRSALGLSGESTAWEEGIEHSDRKRLYPKLDELDESDGQLTIDHNDNRAAVSAAGFRIQSDSAYASQHSLSKPRLLPNGGDCQPQQLLPATYSMKDQLLASEL